MKKTACQRDQSHGERWSKSVAYLAVCASCAAAAFLASFSSMALASLHKHARCWHEHGDVDTSKEELPDSATGATAPPTLPAIQERDATIWGPPLTSPSSATGSGRRPSCCPQPSRCARRHGPCLCHACCHEPEQYGRRVAGGSALAHPPAAQWPGMHRHSSAHHGKTFLLGWPQPTRYEVCHESGTKEYESESAQVRQWFSAILSQHVQARPTCFQAPHLAWLACLCHLWHIPHIDQAVAPTQ